MPYVNIKVTNEGVTQSQKETLITATTEMLQTVLKKKPASTFVVIEEVDTDNWGVGGIPVTALRSQAESATTKETTNE